MAARIVDFNALPKSVRERFLGGIDGTAPPRPLLAVESPYKAAIFGWSCLILSGVGTAYAMLANGYGWRVQGPEAVVGYLIGFGLTLVGILAIVRRVRLQRALPWKPGRYLFPMDCIDARTSRLRLIPMNSLIDFRGVHHHTNGGYTGTHLHFTFEGGLHEEFVVRSKVLAESVLTQLRTSQATIQRAAAERDIDTIFAMDPFLEVRVHEGWNAKAPMSIEDIDGPKARPVGALASHAVVWGAAAAIGLVAAVPIWLVRNRSSDEAMFRRATASASESDFEEYLYSGGKRHAEEVRTTLLPKAALAEAVKKGSVTALHEFLKKYPGSCVDAEARDDIHKLFVKTLADFRDEAAADPALGPFMEKLVGFLEKSESSNVDVRFHSPSVASLEVVDKLLKSKSGADVVGQGTLVPVSPHFDDQHSVPREAAIVKNLQAAFSSVFPADIMSLQTGKRIVVVATDEQKAALAKPKLALKPGKAAKVDPAPPVKAALPDVEIPTLDVRYEVRWAGDIYTEEKGDRKFVGIVVTFDVAMRVPNDAESYEFSLEVRPPDTFSVSYSDPSGLGDIPGLHMGAPTEGQVYDVMASRAFDELTQKLRAVFFRAGSKANAPAPVKKRGAIADDDDDDAPPKGTDL